MIKNSRKILEILKKNSRLLKALFLFSVLLFVVNQMTGILQGMTWHQLGEIIFSLRKRHLVIMIVTGLVAVMPMMTYDWVTVSILEEGGKPRMPRKYLLTSAWATNTINNLAGFGGVIGATLRARFYGREVETKKTVATVSKVALFMLTGLSFLCFIAMIDSYLIHDNHPFKNYWVWLFGGSLVAPGIIGFVIYKRSDFFQEFTNKRICQLFLGSIGQWAGALGTFLMIGYLLQVDVPLLTVYPLFIAATFIGMISMVPGGMGTFDVLMIVGLGTIGVPKELAVGWLLFYRIFYYLVPFLTGIYSLIHQLGAKANDYLEGIPKKVSQRLAHFTLVTMVYFAGLLMILLSTVPNLSTINQLFQKLFPLSFNLLDQKLNMLVGFLLLGLARGVSQRVKKAYLPTMAVLIFAIVNTIAHTVSWQLLVFYGLLLAVLFWSRHEFYRKQLVFTPETILVDGLLYGGLLILYSVVGYYSTDRLEHGAPPSQFLLFPSEGVWIEGAIGLLLAALTISALYHYLSGNAPIGEAYQGKRLADFKATLATQPEPAIVTQTSEYQYYYQVAGMDQLVINFNKKGSQLAVLGDPIGEEAMLEPGIKAFLNQADEWGYQVLFYGITADFTLFLHNYGYNFMKIGEVGYLESGEASHFPTDLLVTVAKAPQTEVSEWLALLEEEGLDWQCYARDGSLLALPTVAEYLASSLVCLAKNNQGETIGLIAHQVDERGVPSYAVLAYQQAAPVTEVKEALLRQGADLFAEKGQVPYDLGFMPLSQVGEAPYAFTKEKVLNGLYRFSLSLAMNRQDVEMKRELATKVTPRYVSYQKNVHSVFLVAQLATGLMTKVTEKSGELKKIIG